MKYLYFLTALIFLCPIRGGATSFNYCQTFYDHLTNLQNEACSNCVSVQATIQRSTIGSGNPYCVVSGLTQDPNINLGTSIEGIKAGNVRLTLSQITQVAFGDRIFYMIPDNQFGNYAAFHFVDAGFDKKIFFESIKCENNEACNESGGNPSDEGTTEQGGSPQVGGQGPTPTFHPSRPLIRNPLANIPNLETSPSATCQSVADKLKSMTCTPTPKKPCISYNIIITKIDATANTPEACYVQGSLNPIPAGIDDNGMVRSELVGGVGYTVLDNNIDIYLDTSTLAFHFNIPTLALGVFTGNYKTVELYRQLNAGQSPEYLLVPNIVSCSTDETCVSPLPTSPPDSIAGVDGQKNEGTESADDKVSPGSGLSPGAGESGDMGSEGQVTTTGTSQAGDSSTHVVFSTDPPESDEDTSQTGDTDQPVVPGDGATGGCNCKINNHHVSAPLVIFWGILFFSFFSVLRGIRNFRTHR